MPSGNRNTHNDPDADDFEEQLNNDNYNQKRGRVKIDEFDDAEQGEAHQDADTNDHHENLTDGNDNQPVVVVIKKDSFMTKCCAALCCCFILSAITFVVVLLVVRLVGFSISTYYKPPRC